MSSTLLPPGRGAAAAVGASSANLGPGFDSLGLALDLVDEVRAEVTEGEWRVEVEGEGVGTVALDRRHLVVSTLLEALAELGGEVAGLELRCRNAIPHGRGLGSSSAALVSGLLLAWGLTRAQQPVDTGWLLQRANALEGHADNVAPAVLGGLVLTWSEVPGGEVAWSAGRMRPGLSAVALVPGQEVLTERARAVLPSQVPHHAAAANAGRAALLVHALAHDPGLLLPATRDWLHQDYRAELMPATDALRRGLRGAGFAALVSGAGPTLLVLLETSRLVELESWAAGPGRRLTAGFELRPLAVGRGARLLRTWG